MPKDSKKQGRKRGRPPGKTQKKPLERKGLPKPLGLSKEQLEELGQANERKDSQETGALIETAYFLYLKKYGRYPPYSWISENTGLDVSTIFRWFQRLSLRDIFQDTRALTRAAIASVAQKVILSGNPDELEKYLRIVEDFETKTTDRAGGAVDITLNFEEVRERRNQIQDKDAVIKDNPAVLGLVTEEAEFTEIKKGE